MQTGKMRGRDQAGRHRQGHGHRRVPGRGAVPWPASRSFIGDDVNDEHGFARRQRAGRQSPSRSATGHTCARWRLPDVAAVRAWLARCRCAWHDFRSWRATTNEHARSGPDRQRHASAPWSTRGARSSGAASRASTATRCSARCCATATRPRTSASSPSNWRTASASNSTTSTNTADPRHPPLRPPRRLRRDHRLRAALRPVRPHVPADDAGAPRAAACRQPARHPAPAPGLRLRRQRPPTSPGAATTSATWRPTWCCG